MSQTDTSGVRHSSASGAADGKEVEDRIDHLSNTKLIVEAGVKLRLSEEAIATACVFYHSFNDVMSAKDYQQELVVMAAVNLAAKVQEVPVKLGDVVNTCHRCLHKDTAPLEVGEAYWQLKESVARYELLMLRSLGFRLNPTLPHKYLLHFLLALSRWVEREPWQRSHVTMIAWALLQDSSHTTLHLKHPPHVIATAVLYLASHCCKLEVAGNRTARRKWWEVFSPTTTESELKDIARVIMDVCDTGNGRTSSSSA